MDGDYIRIPPHDNDAEQSVMGAILLDYRNCMEYMDSIRADDFYKDAHQLIFSAMYELYKKGDIIDLITLKNCLQIQNKLESVGGIYYLSGLSESTPSAANIKYYIEIVKKAAEQRRLIMLGNEITSKAFNKEEPENIINDSTEKLFNISSADKKGKVISKDKIVSERKKGLIQRLTNEVVGTYYPSVDRIISNGFQKKQVSILCGRPGMGKSAVKENISKLQCENFIKTLHITPEQGFDTEMDRFTSIKSGVPLYEIIRMKDWATTENGKIYTEYKDKLRRIREAASEISKWDIHFLSGRIDVPILRRTILEVKNKYGLDIVWVDLFNKLSEIIQETQKKPQVITKCLANIARIAEECDVHICLLHQLSREVERRGDKHPMLSDLKESGAFEEDAWLVMGLYRDAVYNKAVVIDDEIELLIMKQRNGATETIKLKWDKETLLISEKNEGF